MLYQPRDHSWQRLCQDLRSTPKEYIFWDMYLSRLAISQAIQVSHVRVAPGDNWSICQERGKSTGLGRLNFFYTNKLILEVSRIFVWWIFRSYLDNWCCQWLFLVRTMGGRWHIITQLAYLPLIYHLYTYSGNQKQLQYWCWLSWILPFWIHVFCWQKKH